MDLRGNGEGKEFRTLVCTGLYQYTPTEVEVQHNRAQTMQLGISPSWEQAGRW